MRGSVTGWLSRLVPRVHEVVSPDFYRLTGKLRASVVVLLAVVATATTLARADVEGVDMRLLWVHQGLLLGVGAIDVALSVWLWKGRLSHAAMGRVTIACGLLDVACQLISVRTLGSVNTHMVGLLLVLVMFYRIAFPLRIAAIVGGCALLGHWTIVALELAGVSPPQPILVSGVDAAYRIPGAQAGAMAVITTMYGFTFVLAHWAVLRLRQSEQAVRVLRHALHGGAAGPAGQHTGRTLGETYDVGALLAAGGMGEVYRGFHRRTGRALAIKFLHPHLIGDPGALERFQREAEIAGRLGNPHIVQVLDVNRDGEQPFMVLELLEGEDLGRRLGRDGALPPALVAELVAQAAVGLQAAREAGVVHRDLKPDNLFLVARAAEPPLLKILDFGISKIQGAATHLTSEVALIGTPDYMAPEQAEGHAAAIDHGSDVFALGAIAYHALTGRKPFASDTIPAVLRAICTREPAPPSGLVPGLGPDVDAVLAIAMAKRPGERYGDARELASDLRLALACALPVVTRTRAARVTRSEVAPKAAPGPQPAATALGDTVDAALATAGTVDVDAK